MNGKCVAIIQNKLSFDDESLTKLRRESEKTLVELFWWDLARVRLVDSRRISKPDYVTQTFKY